MCACVCVLGRCGAFLLLLTKSRASSAQCFCSFPAWIPCAAARPARWEQFAGPPRPCWILAESKAAYLLLWDRIQNLLPFLCHRSLTKPTSEAVGGSAALPPTSSPSWGAGGSPPALWPLCAARVGSQQQLGVRLTCPASSSALPRSIQRGFASLSSRGRFPWALWKRPRYPPRGRVSSRAENTWQRSAERKGMPFASSFSVLPGFSRFPERKNCIFLFFNQCLEVMLGSFF